LPEEAANKNIRNLGLKLEKEKKISSILSHERDMALEAIEVERAKIKELEKLIRKFKLEGKLRKKFASELDRQKQIAIDAKDTAAQKTKELEKLLKKQKLEALLRKKMSSQMDRQKKIAIEAQEIAIDKKNQLEAVSNQLAKYLAPQIYKSIFAGDSEVNVISQRKKLTVFFSDIVGFTDITDSLEAEEISSMLNFYLTEMSHIALSYGGTIDKYVGDAILIFFGDPETNGAKEDALKCVSMALAMQRRMEELESEWAERFGLREPLKIRVGIATGFCTVGNFGSEDRLDYTVIGSQVNLASRLESIAKPGSVLISFDTYSQVSGNIDCRELERVSVKGIREKVRTFEALSEHGMAEEILKIEINGLKLSADMKRIDVEGINELEKFVENARKILK